MRNREGERDRRVCFRHRDVVLPANNTITKHLTQTTIAATFVTVTI